MKNSHQNFSVKSMPVTRHKTQDTNTRISKETFLPGMYRKKPRSVYRIQLSKPHRSASLEAIHEGEHLGYDTALDLAVGLVSLGGDGVDLVDEDDRRRVLLRLLIYVCFTTRIIGGGSAETCGARFGFVLCIKCRRTNARTRGNDRK